MNRREFIKAAMATAVSLSIPASISNSVGKPYITINGSGVSGEFLAGDTVMIWSRKIIDAFGNEKPPEIYRVESVDIDGDITLQFQEN